MCYSVLSYSHSFFFGFYFIFFFFFFFKQKTAYEMCGRDWSSDVCSSDLDEWQGLVIVGRQDCWILESRRQGFRRIIAYGTRSPRLQVLSDSLSMYSSCCGTYQVAFAPLQYTGHWCIVSSVHLCYFLSGDAVSYCVPLSDRTLGLSRHQEWRHCPLGREELEQCAKVLDCVCQPPVTDSWRLLHSHWNYDAMISSRIDRNNNGHGVLGNFSFSSAMLRGTCNYLQAVWCVWLYCILVRFCRTVLAVWIQVFIDVHDVLGSISSHRHVADLYCFNSLVSSLRRLQHAWNHHQQSISHHISALYPVAW